MLFIPFITNTLITKRTSSISFYQGLRSGKHPLHKIDDNLSFMKSTTKNSISI